MPTLPISHAALAGRRDAFVDKIRDAVNDMNLHLDA